MKLGGDQTVNVTPDRTTSGHSQHLRQDQMCILQILQDNMMDGSQVDELAQGMSVAQGNSIEH